MARKEYALYRGEEILCIGTVDEIAEKQGIRPETIYFYTTPAHQKRRANSKNAMIAIEIEDDDAEGGE